MQKLEPQIQPICVRGRARTSQARSSTGLQVLRECRVQRGFFPVPDRHGSNGLVPRPDAVRTQLRTGRITNGVARVGAAAPAALTFEVEYTVARLAARTVEAAAPWARCGRFGRWRQVHAATVPASGRRLDWRIPITGAALRQTGSEVGPGRLGSSPERR